MPPRPMPRRPAPASGPPTAPPVREPAMPPRPVPPRLMPPRPIGGGTLPPPIAPIPAPTAPLAGPAHAEMAPPPAMPARARRLEMPPPRSETPAHRTEAPSAPVASGNGAPPMGAFAPVVPLSADKGQHGPAGMGTGLPESNAPRAPCYRSRRIVLGSPHVEDVAVTVAHAPSVDHGRWHPLDVFVHVASLEDEVSRIVRAKHGTDAARASRGAKLARGSVVRIELHLESAELDIEALEMRWMEDIQRARFRYRPSAGTTELRGSVDLYVGRALLCSVAVAMMVFDEPQDTAPVNIA